MASIEDKASFSEGKFRTALAADEAGLRACLAMVGLLLIGRVILAATTNLAEDEAYYWLWSTHLATGYYDHPPMIAYWIRAGTSIFGQTTFGVRAVGLLSAVAGSYLLYRTSLSLFRDRKAHRGDDLAGFQRGLEQTLEEIIAGDLSPVGHDSRTEAEHA